MNDPKSADPKKTAPKDNGKFYDALGRASIMGLHFVSGAIVGGGFGYLFDKWVETGPWGFLIGLLLGLAAGFLNMWRDAKELMRDD